MQSAECKVQNAERKTENTKRAAQNAESKIGEQPQGTGVQKGTRVRKVFGRREAEVDGHVVRVELRADGVHVRRKRSHRDHIITFRDLWCVANGQGLLRL